MQLTPEATVTDEHVGPLANSASLYEAQVERAVIDSEEALAKAGDLYKFINNHIKKGEDARTGLVKPLNDHVKWINAQFKPVKEQLENVRGALKKKMDTYVAEQRRIQEQAAAEAKKKAEEEALARAEKFEQEGNKEAAEAVVEAAASLPDTVPKTDIARGNYNSSTSSRADWKGEVVDLKVMLGAIIRGDLPEDFITVNQSRIDAFARSKKVEKEKWGIRLFKKVTAMVR
jgi:hypothetical protein